jgi:hypothetical protein
LVCDECGRPDATSVTIRASDQNYVKDLCAEHLRALLKNTRAPRRGRPRTSTARTSSRRTAGGTRRKKASAPKATRRKRSGAKSRAKAAA